MGYIKMQTQTFIGLKAWLWAWKSGFRQMGSALWHEVTEWNSPNGLLNTLSTNKNNVTKVKLHETKSYSDLSKIFDRVWMTKSSAAQSVVFFLGFSWPACWAANLRCLAWDQVAVCPDSWKVEHALKHFLEKLVRPSQDHINVSPNVECVEYGWIMGILLTFCTR